MISNEIKEDLIKGLNIIMGDKMRELLLYGSVARGDDNVDSDVDIAMIVKSKLSDREKKMFIHWNAQMDMKYDRVFSIIDVEEELLKKWGDMVPFYKNIKSEGIVLWKAA